ncbi:hypothetical protein EAE96_009507 [Botrytis aclada]|nr:hypothetical protein EAE96_009507 [Botrytis aclada]
MVDYILGTGVIGNPFTQSFMQEVEKLVAEKIGELSTSTSNIHGFYPNTSSSPVTTYESRQRDPDYSLPTREQADSLLTSYFDNVHVLYPFLYKLELEEYYEAIWNCDNHTTDQGSLICLVNSTFAISSLQARTTVSRDENMAAIFCRRAQRILNMRMRSIRSVHSYFLLALYYQSRGKSHTCWLYVGNAVRTAQILELHLPETSERIVESQTKESLRKVSHSCVLMDREVSILYGRPSMIDPQAIATITSPLLAEENNYQPRNSEENTDGELQAYTADLYKSCLNLYEIFYAVLFDSRHSKPDRNLMKGHYTSKNISSTGTNISILNLQERLSNWKRNNPDHLRIENHSTFTNPNAMLACRAVFFHQKHLHIQLILSTPILQQLIGTELQNKAERIPLRSTLSSNLSPMCNSMCQDSPRSHRHHTPSQNHSFERNLHMVDQHDVPIQVRNRTDRRESLPFHRS